MGRGDGGRPGFDSARTRTFGPRVDLRYLHSLDMERLLDSTLDEAPALRELSLASATAGELVPLMEGGLPKALASQFEQRDVDGLRKWATDSPRAAHNLCALLGSIPLDVDLLTLSPRVSNTEIKLNLIAPLCAQLIVPHPCYSCSIISSLVHSYCMYSACNFFSHQRVKRVVLSIVQPFDLVESS